MNETQATAVMLALFALRCLAPLAITMALGYLMNRLIDRWEREEAAQPPAPEAAPAAQRPAVPPPAWQLPCWVTRSCEPERRAGCAARRQPHLPCWLARLQADGALPADCPDCPIYRRAHAMA